MIMKTAAGTPINDGVPVLYCLCYFFHFKDAVFRFQIPMKIAQLLLIIPDCFIRQFPRATVKTILLDCLRKPHTKTPLSFDKSIGKRGCFTVVQLLDDDIAFVINKVICNTFAGV